ncbi:alpha/beta fold hydrolase [Streptomyces sp. URMC 123]|uniref:alpha/beta fold hydrolase n=1 Tax=Streptomyces sp. URMC 123 TaxID=3423403 RepID=UPI003F1CD362
MQASISSPIGPASSTAVGSAARLGVLAATTTLRPDYEQVVSRVIDALGVERVGLIGLSLGGYFAARTAALEPRVAALATVSGPFRRPHHRRRPGRRRTRLMMAARPPPRASCLRGPARS